MLSEPDAVGNTKMNYPSQKSCHLLLCWGFLMLFQNQREMILALPVLICTSTFFFFCITNFYIFTLLLFQFYWDIIVGTSSDDSMVRNPSQCRSHRECRFNLWVEKILWGGNGNPLQDSCQDNAMDRGAWWATVPEVTKGQTRLSDGADMHSCASSKEQPRRLREVTKSTVHKESPPWHKLQLWKTANGYYASYEK